MTDAGPLDPGFRYLTDTHAPGLLHAAVLRSPHAHARLSRVDVSAARVAPGVLAVVTARDIPGKSMFGIRIVDQPILCGETVRAVGDPIAAVAAETLEQARLAVALIAVDYEILPAVTDPARALDADAPRLYPDGNLVHATRHARGDMALADGAAYIVEDIYETPRQVHGFIETEGAVAVPDGPVLVVHAPGHWAEIERLEIAGFLARDPATVRVVASPVGGSYGGKDQLHAQPIAALLAHLTGRPVRLRYDREESFAIGVKRHPFVIAMRSTADSAGRLLTHEARLLADSGAYAQHGPEVLETAHENVQGPYAWRAVNLAGKLVATNNGVSGAMRGFGAVQVQTALELQIDRLARLAGIDPHAFRAMNLRSEGAPGQLGQTLVAPVHAAAALRGIEPPAPAIISGRELIGDGIALVEKGEGFAGGGPNHAAVRLEVETPGRVAVSLGLSELGQGLAEAARAAVVILLGCAPQDVTVRLADTLSTPDSGPIAASRGAGIAWRTIVEAGPPFLAALRERAARLGVPDAGRLVIGSGGLTRPGGNAPTIAFSALADPATRVEASAPKIETDTGDGAVHAAFSACAALARVAVDRLTGRVRVLSVRLVPVTGPLLSPAGLRAQMEGGASMAAGFVTMEDLPAAGGRFRARNLDGYMLPMMADAFPVDVEAIDDIPSDVLGPRGVGEIGVNAAAPAIATAILAATGFVARRLPVDPEAMLAHLDGRLS